MPKIIRNDPDEMSSGLTQSQSDPTTPEQTPFPEPVPLPPFPVVPGYKVRRRLGSGGMGVVYLAQETGLDRLVALKLLHTPAAADPTAAARFAEEARIVARLHHPNIVPLYRFGDAGGVPFLALEYEPGPTLKHFAAGRPQPPGWAAAVVEQVARATQYAHDHGVVHRDLKPANILLAASEAPPGCRPRVVDFGLARALDCGPTQTVTGVAVGTPRYMSPEQASGRPDRIGPWSDVYALGVTLYELLTGQPPFPHADSVAALLAVRDQAPVRPGRVRPGVPRDLDAICLKCLEKRPEDRYPTAGDLAADLARFRSGQAVLARRPTAAATAYRVVRRYPGVSALAAGLLGTLVAGSVTSTVFYLRAERERDAAVAALRQARTDRDAADAIRAVEADLRAGAEAAAASAREQAARADAATANAQQTAARLTSVNRFLYRGLLATDRPIGAGGLGPDTTLRQLLDRMADRLKSEPPDPESLPEVYYTLALAYNSIGAHHSAVECYDRAAGEFTRLFGPAHERVMSVRRAQIQSLRTLGQTDQGRETADRYARDLAAVVGANDPRVVEAESWAAGVVVSTAPLAGVRPVITAAREHALAVHGPHHPTVARLTALLRNYDLSQARAAVYGVPGLVRQPSSRTGDPARLSRIERVE